MILIQILIVLVYIILKSQDNIGLACGIFAFIGTNPKRYFNWDKFNLLGIFNDTRGGDACGRVYGNIVQYGTGIQRTYKEFGQVNKVPIKTTKVTTILGHCRKASSGGKDDIYAQPIIIKKKDINYELVKNVQLKHLIDNAQDEDIVFSGIHNGTIDNYEELADKYKIPLESHNDTKVLLTILFYGNHKVLKEYIGTAALIWHNHLNNTSYLFKGSSKMWVGNKDISEERPLFLWQIARSNFYLSSIEDSLRFIGAAEDEVISIFHNTLYKFVDGVNISSKKYDRSELTQSKIKEHYNSTNYKKYDNFHRGNESRGEAYRFPALPSIYKNIGIDDDCDPEYNYYSGLEKNRQGALFIDEGKKYIRQFFVSNVNFRVTNEKVDSFLSSGPKRIIYNKTRYWMNGGLMHGIYLLSSFGSVPSAATREAIPVKLNYFVEGVLMNNYTTYKKSLEFHENFINSIHKEYIDLVYLESAFTFDIAKYSRYPIAPLLNIIDTQEVYSCVNFGPDPIKNYYTGTFQPLYSYRRYSFNNGCLDSVKDLNELKSNKITEEDVRFSELYLKEAGSKTPMDWVHAVGFNLLTFDRYNNPLSPFQKIMIYDKNVMTEKEVDIYLLHYMRDFDSELRDQCRLCKNEDTNSFHICNTCEKFTDQLYRLYEKPNGNVK